jgi:hypothetical protein
MIDDRHINVLRAVARYYVLNRAQIQRLCFPTDQGGRVTRRHIAELAKGGFIARTQLQVVVPGSGSTAPAFYPTRKGCEFLVEFTDDRSFLAVSNRSPNPHHLLHWLAISETHIALDGALDRQSDVRCEAWFNEWDTTNAEESLPEKRFKLYTLLQDKPRLVCVPDAAFLLSVDGHAKVYYLEQDRNTSGIFQVAASKTPGYAALAERRHHRKHFPATMLDVFAVLMIAPDARRRDALKRAIGEKPGASLWRFAASEDLTPETFLAAPIWHACEGEPRSLIKPKMAEVAS